MRQILFLALLLGCNLYALLKGRRPERIGAITLLADSVLSWAVNSPLATRYASVELSILVVDLVALLIFAVLALTSDRYWPLWVTALQLLVVLAHVAKLADPDMLRNGYGFVMAAWSYPQLLAIALGVRSVQRERGRSAAAT